MLQQQPDAIKIRTQLCPDVTWLFFSIRHDEVIKWKHFPCSWPFVQGIHRSPVNSPHKGQWRGTLRFSWICLCTNVWINNLDPSDLRWHHSHYDVTVMIHNRHQGCEWAQPMTDDVTMQHWISLSKPIHRMIAGHPFFVWQHQAISWTNVNFSLLRNCGIYLRAIA